VPLGLLEEIRMLTNLAADGQPAVRLALAGGASLEERFASPKLDSFSQRLVARCYLEAMGHAETRDYVRSQVERVGGDGAALFPDETCEAVYQATDGVPRLINQVCDHALLLGYAGGFSPINPNMIQEAWADLQQLPTPWNAEESSEGGIVEFGGLEDAPPATPDEQDNHPDAPSLRISPETALGETEEDDPAGQVEQIEAMLAGAEEERPGAGPDTPELELVFDDPDNLLTEPFEDEEVLGDRVAVTTGPHPDSPDNGQPASGDDLERVMPEPPPVDGPPEPVAPPVDPLAAAAPIDEPGQREPQPVLVEEDVSESAEPAACGPDTRRQTYRRLFAKLRYGSARGQQVPFLN